MEEILSFGAPEKLNLAEALKQLQEKKVEKKPKSNKWSSGALNDSDSCDEDDRGRGHSRRRKRRVSERGGVAARLRQQAEALEQCLDTSPACNNGDGHDSSEEKDVQKFSPPLSPIPSPPPLFFAPPEPKISKTLLKADQLLQELKQPQLLSSSLSESFLDQSSVLELSGVSTPSTAPDQTMTVRVRCRGKIHRFTVNKADPLILLCGDLGKELGVKGEQILLSHRTATLSSTSSPATLGLSTVDIIDAIVLQEGQVGSEALLDTSGSSLDSTNSITLKVQTSKKSVVYKLAKTDALGKVMTAFAAALEVPVSQLQFTFDGDPISPDHTPTNLDMDHDDIIDARLLS